MKKQLRSSATISGHCEPREAGALDAPLCSSRCLSRSSSAHAPPRVPPACPRSPFCPSALYNPLPPTLPPGPRMRLCCSPFASQGQLPPLLQHTCAHTGAHSCTHMHTRTNTLCLSPALSLSLSYSGVLLSQKKMNACHLQGRG